jgi:hypothetical protein
MNIQTKYLIAQNQEFNRMSKSNNFSANYENNNFSEDRQIIIEFIQNITQKSKKNINIDEEQFNEIFKIMIELLNNNAENNTKNNTKNNDIISLKKSLIKFRNNKEVLNATNEIEKIERIIATF